MVIASRSTISSVQWLDQCQDTDLVSVELEHHNPATVVCTIDTRLWNTSDYRTMLCSSFKKTDILEIDSLEGMRFET